MIKLIFSDDGTAMTLDVVVRKKSEGYTVIFPESGLHPSEHTAITEGLYTQYKAGVLGEEIYVATHSELVILRAMRMIREGRATTHDFELWQTFLGRDGAVIMKQIRLSEEGEFIDHIKGGFFEHGFNERFA